MSRLQSYSPGSEAFLHDRACIIKRPIDVDKVLIEFKDTGDTATAELSSLKGKPKKSAPKTKPVDAIPEADMKIAQERLETIQPLLDLEHRRSKDVKARSKEAGVSTSTLYSWIKLYTDRRLLSDLAPNRRNSRKKRIKKKAETVIQDVIEELYLTKQKVSQKKAADEVRRRCKAANIKTPHHNTIYARLRAIDEKERVKKRHGVKAAREKFSEIRGKFPHANYPLDVVQIDHTPLDIEIVDDEHRMTIGRPWLTLAIDVYSRMVTGLYLSLDAPSAFSVGMCVQHSALEKYDELSRLKIDAEWPVWGLMRTIHADNGKDFKSETIQASCAEYGITTEWRPLGKPDWGGHIERLLGTLNKEIHTLPGTTFSNVQQKGDYKSGKKAALTLSELHEWLIHYILGVYHKREHKGIGTSPLERWREGIFGKGKIKGIGHIDPITDPERFRIDFLPHTERTVQRDGIVWDKLYYFSGVIRHWINAKKGKNKAKFRIRRDPRDISKIYFLDPELQTYLEVPYSDISKPTVSLWEYRAAERNLRQQGIENIDEDSIFAAYEEMMRIADGAKKQTRKTRREGQRKKIHKKSQENQDVPHQENAEKPETVRLIVDNSKGSAPEEEYFEADDSDAEQQWEEWT